MKNELFKMVIIADNFKKNCQEWIDVCLEDSEDEPEFKLTARDVNSYTEREKEIFEIAFKKGYGAGIDDYCGTLGVEKQFDKWDDELVHY